MTGAEMGSDARRDRLGIVLEAGIPQFKVRGGDENVLPSSASAPLQALRPEGPGVLCVKPSEVLWGQSAQRTVGLLIS